MKSTSILILGTITTLLLSACSTSNNVVSNRLLSKRKYTKGFHIRSNGMTREEKKAVSDEGRYNITLKDQFEKKSRNGSSIAIVQKGEEIDHYKNEALEDFSHETGDELLDLRFLSDQNVLNDKPNIERPERTLKTENYSQFNERS